MCNWFSLLDSCHFRLRLCSSGLSCLRPAPGFRYRLGEMVALRKMVQIQSANKAERTCCMAQQNEGLEVSSCWSSRFCTLGHLPTCCFAAPTRTCAKRVLVIGFWSKNVGRWCNIDRGHCWTIKKKKDFDFHTCLPYMKKPFMTLT